MCVGERWEHVNAVWFERLCHINGVQWPVEAVQTLSIALFVANPWSQMTTSWSLVANIVSSSIVSRDLSILADRDAHVAIKISQNLQHQFVPNCICIP